MQEVIIEVRGGIAEVVQKPSGVQVVIRDYDNETETEEASEAIYAADTVVK